MERQWITVGVAVAGLSLATLQQVDAQTEGGIVVRKDHADCIRDAVDHYLGTGRDPVFIYSGFCLQEIYDPDPDTVAQVTTENTFSSPTIRLPDGSLVSRNEMATLLILTRQQLGCLEEMFEDVTFTPTPTDDGTPWPPDYIGLDFSGC
ncbi:hypothetical protein [Thalassorhabdomicrobium marinisediminis]|uniref:Uncharacterized protein n=1 Tax=Thalassorhabdomicrobium marinisediminis TaxID=2170577 RepID=A0A2T7FY53_9RHOB|nr:hypothetical protein [Thalassorhabdomicrobium marinisediminis]PVA07092.1 hypothetical protein DC363_08125 [Thalassorhabdomicrobium marinisediminis]